MEISTQTNISELDQLPPIKLKTKRRIDPVLLKKYALTYESDKSLPIVLNIHPKGDSYKKPEYPEPTELLVGSKKRKRSAYEGYRPEKYDGRQFRYSWIKGNESADDISKMKAESLNIDLDNDFFEEQSKFCEDFLKNFVKNKNLERELDMVKKAEKEALIIYEVSEIKNLPLDVPEAAVDIIKNRAKKLEKEYEKVRDYSEGCIKDMISTAFKEEGAGPYRKQRLIVGESMVNEREQREYIPPNFDSLSEASAYRIMSYYDMPQKYSDLDTMKKVIAENFEQGKYYPEAEILSAIGTARLGTNDIEFKGGRNEVDELYIDNLFKDADLSDSSKKKSSPKKKKQPAVVLQQIDSPNISNKLMRIEQHFNIPSSSSLLRDEFDIPSTSSKGVSKTRTLPKRVTRGVKRTL